MFERFLTRVGKAGAIAILAAVILAIGFTGGLVEHFRLAATSEQQQVSTDQKESSSDQTGDSQEGQAGDHASGARRQNGSTDDTAMNVRTRAAA
jgi:hypothetical protein